MKRGHFIILFLIFALPSIVSAQAVITEIMYDPPGVDSGHEWIEVYDASSSPLELNGTYVSEGGKNHRISGAATSVIAPFSYAVIAENAADFAADHPDFAGEIFHASYSLNNTGATISVRDKKLNDIADASYTGVPAASGEGNSLQRAPDAATVFLPRTPTPGAPISSTMIPLKASVPQSSANKKSKKKSALQKPATMAQGGAAASAMPDIDNGIDTSIQSIPATAQIAAAEDSSESSLWWLGIGSLALLAMLGIFLSRKFARKEWRIDEIEET